MNPGVIFSVCSAPNAPSRSGLVFAVASSAVFSICIGLMVAWNELKSGHLSGARSESCTHNSSFERLTGVAVRNSVCRLCSERSWIASCNLLRGFLQWCDSSTIVRRRSGIPSSINSLNNFDCLKIPWLVTITSDSPSRILSKAWRSF